MASASRVNPFVSALVIGAAVLAVGGVGYWAVRSGMPLPFQKQEQSVFGAHDERDNFDAIRSKRDGIVIGYPSGFTSATIKGLAWVQSAKSDYDFSPDVKYDGPEFSGLLTQVKIVQDDQKPLEDRVKSLKLPVKDLARATTPTLQHGYELYSAKNTSNPKIVESYVIPVGKRIYFVDLYATSQEQFTKDREGLMTALSTFHVLSDSDWLDFRHYFNEEKYFQVDIRNDFAVVAEDYAHGAVSFATYNDGIHLDVALQPSAATVDSLGAAFGGSKDEVKTPLYTATRFTKSEDNKEIVLAVISTTRGLYTLTSTIQKDELSLWDLEKTRFINSFKVQDVVAAPDWQKVSNKDLRLTFYVPQGEIKTVDNGYSVAVPGHDNATVRILSYANPGLGVEDWIDRRDLNLFKGASMRYMRVKEFTQIHNVRALRAVDPIGQSLHRDFYIPTATRMYIVSLDPFEPGAAPDAEAFENTVVESLVL